MDLLAIKQLKLCYAFRGKNPGVEDCITTKNDKIQWVIDDEKSKSSHFIDEEMPGKCLCICNENNHDIVLLPIDHKLIKNHKGGIADCAIFDNVLFCFVEFKSNASGNSVLQVNETYEKAIKQLKETVNLFEKNMKQVKVEFRAVVEVNCDIVVAERFPRQTATEQSLKIAFAKDMKGIPLYFSREIKF